MFVVDILCVVCCVAVFCNVYRDLFMEGLWVFGVFYGRDSPSVGHGLLIHGVSRSHTTTHHSR
jgi:hypothetical protein